MDAPAPDTMIVRVQFIDFTATPVSEEALAWMRNFSFDVKPGRVTMVTELIDARSGNTVIRMADIQDGMSQGIAHWLQTLLYYDAPAWVFVVCYTLFGLLVVGSWFWVRARRFGN